jgi:hypothetical protein
MIIDKALQLDLANPITVTAASVNVIDQGAAGNAIGNELYMTARVGTAFTAAGAGTLNIQLQTSVDLAFTTPIVLYDSGPIAKTALAANTEVVKVLIPPGSKRYIRAYYIVGTGPMTAGTIDINFSIDVQIK